jgi:hypothetical protein
MTNSIVTSELPESISKEFSIDENGHGFISRKGLARLCGVSKTAIQKFLARIQEGNQTLPKNLVAFAGYSFERGDLPIPDIIASAIIKYYSRQGRETAQNTDDALGAIGLRTVIQKALNYQPVQRRSLTQSEIIELCILPVPSDWQRRFPEEYYEHLSRLTGLEQFGASRPQLWAKCTKELVYDWLPTGIYDAVKCCKQETGGYEKLHQFLSTDGLKILENHQKQLLTLMNASASMEQLKTLLSQSCTKQYQLILIERK